MELLVKFKNIEILEVNRDQYCVRYRYKSIFGKPKHKFFVLNKNGTDFKRSDLITDITMHNLDDAMRVFSANVVKMSPEIEFPKQEIKRRAFPPHAN